ncbi:MAG: rubrerythrin family protein, partial [Acidobacteriota bacterium]
ENLEIAIEGEGFEVNEMYPVYIEVARKQGEKGAETATSWALAAEKVHEKLYKKAKETAAQGKDADITVLNVCSVCGFTVEGEAPAKCPVCGSPREKFKEF